MMDSRTLFDNGTVALRDVQCHPHGPGRGPEECTDGHRVVLLRRGAFVMHIERRRVLVNPNHALFINGGVPYRISHPVPGGDDCTSIAIPGRILLDLLERLGRSCKIDREAPFRWLHAPLAERTIVRHQLLHRRIHSETADRLEIEETTLALVCQALERTRLLRLGRPRARRARTLRRHTEAVEATKLILTREVGENHSLAQLARQVHFSEFHLSRIFRENTGMPIHRYRTRLRLALAVERLMDGESDLAKLALELGFATHSHFTGVFTRRIGRPPSSIRAGRRTHGATAGLGVLATN